MSNYTVPPTTCSVDTHELRNTPRKGRVLVVSRRMDEPAEMIEYFDAHISFAYQLVVLARGSVFPGDLLEPSLPPP